MATAAYEIDEMISAKSIAARIEAGAVPHSPGAPPDNAPPRAQAPPTRPLAAAHTAPADLPRPTVPDITQPAPTAPQSRAEPAAPALPSAAARAPEQPAAPPPQPPAIAPTTGTTAPVPPAPSAPAPPPGPAHPQATPPAAPPIQPLQVTLRPASSPQVVPAAQALFSQQPAPETDSLLSATEPARALSNSAPPVAAQPDTPRPLPLPPQVMAQLAERAPDLRAGPVEIQLSPEELGRVRMTLSSSEQSMQVQITAERPETQDLIRRHLDVLAEDLRRQGFTDIDFRFGQDRGGSDSAHDHAPGGTSTAEPEPVAAPRAQTLTIAPTGRLDIRL